MRFKAPYVQNERPLTRSHPFSHKSRNSRNSSRSFQTLSSLQNLKFRWLFTFRCMHRNADASACRSFANLLATFANYSDQNAGPESRTQSRSLEKQIHQNVSSRLFIGSDEGSVFAFRFLRFMKICVFFSRFASKSQRIVR